MKILIPENVFVVSVIPDSMSKTLLIPIPRIVIPDPGPVIPDPGPFKAFDPRSHIPRYHPAFSSYFRFRLRDCPKVSKASGVTAEYPATSDHYCVLVPASFALEHLYKITPRLWFLHDISFKTVYLFTWCMTYASFLV